MSLTLEYFTLNQEEFVKDRVLKVFDIGTTVRIELKVTVSIDSVYTWREITGVNIVIKDIDKVTVESGAMTYEDNGIYFYNFDTSQVAIIPGIYGVTLTAINGASQTVKTVTRAMRLEGLMPMTTTSTSTSTTTTTTT